MDGTAKIQQIHFHVCSPLQEYQPQAFNLKFLTLLANVSLNLTTFISTCRYLANLMKRSDPALLI